MIKNGFTLFVVLAMATATGCGRSKTQGQVVVDSVSGRGADTVADTSKTERRPPVTNAPKSIDAVLAAHSDSLMAVPGVLGTAVGRCNGAPCIRVLVGRVSDEIRRRVPRTLEGYPVHIDVTGTIVPR